MKSVFVLAALAAVALSSEVQNFDVDINRHPPNIEPDMDGHHSNFEVDMDRHRKNFEVDINRHPPNIEDMDRHHSNFEVDMDRHRKNFEVDIDRHASNFEVDMDRHAPKFNADEVPMKIETDPVEEPKNVKEEPDFGEVVSVATHIDEDGTEVTSYTYTNGARRVVRKMKKLYNVDTDQPENFDKTKTEVVEPKIPSSIPSYKPFRPIRRPIRIGFVIRKNFKNEKIIKIMKYFHNGKVDISEEPGTAENIAMVEEYYYRFRQHNPVFCMYHTHECQPIYDYPRYPYYRFHYPGLTHGRYIKY